MKSIDFKKRQLFLTFLFCNFLVLLFSQDNVIIDYDAAGNRIIVHRLTQRVPNEQHFVVGYGGHSGTVKGENVLGNAISNIGKEISSVANNVTVNTKNIIDFTTESIGNLAQSTSTNSTEQFFISPNPSTDIITVSEQKQSDVNYNIVLYDACGKIVEQYINKLTPFVIDLVNCKAGFYYLKIYRQNLQQTIKIVKI